MCTAGFSRISRCSRATTLAACLSSSFLVTSAAQIPRGTTCYISQANQRTSCRVPCAASLQSGLQATPAQATSDPHNFTTTESARSTSKKRRPSEAWSEGEWSILYSFQCFQARQCEVAALGRRHAQARTSPACRETAPMAHDSLVAACNDYSIRCVTFLKRSSHLDIATALGETRTVHIQWTETRVRGSSPTERRVNSPLSAHSPLAASLTKAPKKPVAW